MMSVSKIKTTRTNQDNQCSAYYDKNVELKRIPDQNYILKLKTKKTRKRKEKTDVKSNFFFFSLMDNIT